MKVKRNPISSGNNVVCDSTFAKIMKWFSTKHDMRSAPDGGHTGPYTKDSWYAPHV